MTDESDSNSAPPQGPSDELELGALAIEGPDAITFLQGYLTSDTEQLGSGVAQLTALTTLKGRVLANGWALRLPAGMALVLSADLVETVMTFLAKYLAFAKSGARILDAPELHTLLSSGSNLPGLTDPTQPLAPQLVTARLALVTAATSDQFLPQMLGLTDLHAVDFAKGCYLGQEIVARAQHRGSVKRTLASLTASPPADDPQNLPAPTIGTPIIDAASGRSIGSLVVRTEAAAAGFDGLAVITLAKEDAAAPAALTCGGWQLTVH